jgi:hypothetical protein
MWIMLKWIVGDRLSGCEVDGTGSVSCSMMDFGIDGVVTYEQYFQSRPTLRFP